MRRLHEVTAEVDVYRGFCVSMVKFRFYWEMSGRLPHVEGCRVGQSCRFRCRVGAGNKDIPRIEKLHKFNFVRLDGD